MTIDELYEKMQEGFQNVNTKVDKLEVQMQDVNTKVDKLEVQMQDVNTKVDKLEVQMRDVNTKIGTLEKQVKTTNKIVDELDKQVKVTNKNVQDIDTNMMSFRTSVEINFKKLNDKLDNTTNSNLAQILTNQTKNQKDISKKLKYNELEHKKFDCRITELELHKRFLG